MYGACSVSSRATSRSRSFRSSSGGRSSGRVFSLGRLSSALVLRALFDDLVELRDHVGVAQRGDVAQLAALADVAQQAAHDLPRARLRQVVGPDDPLRARELADPLSHVLADLGLELLGALVVVALERDEGADRLAGV